MIRVIIRNSIISGLLIALPYSSCIENRDTEIQQLLWGQLEPGSYKVGFITFNHPDNNNLEVSLWYPARESADERKIEFWELLRFSEYLNEGDIIGDITASKRRQILAKEINVYSKNIPDTSLLKILESKTRVTYNAEQNSESFPLVLWSARNGTSIAQSILNEFLASHGFIVAYARNLEFELMFPWDLPDSETKLHILRQHLQDLELALDMLLDNASVDTSNVALFTWSYGGESATLLQTRRKEIDAVFSLSSNTLSGWVYQEKDTLNGFDQEQITVPYFYFIEERKDSLGNIVSPPAVMGELSNEVYYLSFKELAHGNFNAIESYIPLLFRIEDIPMWSNKGNVAIEGYKNVCELAVSFLKDYFDEDKTINADGIVLQYKDVKFQKFR